jgi:hypothetical protein
MTKRLPTEFAVNMMLSRFMILQQSEISKTDFSSYFDKANPCHLYFICKRPRISLNLEKFKVTKEHIYFYVNEQNKANFIEHEIIFSNNLETLDVEIKSEYPFNEYEIYREKQLYSKGILSHLLQQNPFVNKDFLDLEILYIGQSYGIDGARTAPDRLVNHSTLQQIYSVANKNNPDYEIWIGLASFSQINLMVMHGFHKFSEEEYEQDEKHFEKANQVLNDIGLNEQQKINFTEAALIRYFKPSYNKIYKDSFPNIAHSTYSECYDLNINSICFEMNIKEMINCYIFSEEVSKQPYINANFLLHSSKERKSIFELF